LLWPSYHLLQLKQHESLATCLDIMSDFVMLSVQNSMLK
jgi:hypothetical protein